MRCPSGRQEEAERGGQAGGPGGFGMPGLLVGHEQEIRAIAVSGREEQPVQLVRAVPERS